MKTQASIGIINPWEHLSTSTNSKKKKNKKDNKDDSDNEDTDNNKDDDPLILRLIQVN